MKLRNPWPIAIVAYFALFISFLIGYIVFASRHSVDLVRPDYYEQEIRFQEQFDRLQRTGAIRAAVQISYDAQGHRIKLVLPSEQARTSRGEITLYRPSNARLDQRMPLAVDAAGIQWINAAALQTGLWKVRVQWAVDGEEFYFDKAVVLPRLRES